MPYACSVPPALLTCLSYTSIFYFAEGSLLGCSVNGVIRSQPASPSVMCGIDFLLQVSAIKEAMAERPVDPMETDITENQLPIIPHDCCHKYHMERCGF